VAFEAKRLDRPRGKLSSGLLWIGWSRAPSLPKEDSVIFIGLDTSKLKISAAVANGGRNGEVRFLGDISSEAPSVASMCLVAERHWDEVGWAIAENAWRFGTAASWSMAPVVAAYQAMRGVAFMTAITCVVEVGDVRRFDNPRQLMAYLGLVPSEHSTGERVGGITKAGNTRARRALIDSLHV
jgi:hypothetical protein